MKLQTRVKMIKTAHSKITLMFLKKISELLIMNCLSPPFYTCSDWQVEKDGGRLTHPPADMEENLHVALHRHTH